MNENLISSYDFRILCGAEIYLGLDNVAELIHKYDHEFSETVPGKIYSIYSYNNYVIILIEEYMPIINKWLEEKFPNFRIEHNIGQSYYNEWCNSTNELNPSFYLTSTFKHEISIQEILNFDKDEFQRVYNILTGEFVTPTIFTIYLGYDRMS